MLQVMDQYSLLFVALAIAFGAVTTVLYVRGKRKSEDEVQAQFVGTLGCLGCVYLVFQIATILSTILAVLPWIGKLIKHMMGAE